MQKTDASFFKPLAEMMAAPLAERLKERFGEDGAAAIVRGTHEAFEKNLDGVMNVGAENPWLKSLLGVVWLSGLWEILEARGMTVPDMSRLTQNALADFTKASVPAAQLPQIRAAMCSKEFVDAIARRSQKRRYADDWIVKTVEPRANDAFEIGYDVFQCPIVKYLKERGLQRFAPYFCLDDFAMFGAMGVKLTRTHTLADGADFCDFRFSREEK